MFLLYFAFVVLLFIPLPRYIGAGNALYDQYLSKETTLPIKGLFVTFVFFRHFTQYVTFSDTILDKMFLFMDNYSGQLIVTMFFFYSGFGIFESIKKKGASYISAFPKKRFLPTWINFAVCLCFFLIYDLIKGRELDALSVLLAFTGWTSIGNSNWFMLVTFIFYFLIIVSFVKLDENTKWGKLLPLIIFTVASLIATCIIYLTKPFYCCNTMLCFPLGMWYSYFKERIDKLLEKHYGFALAGAIAAVMAGFIMFSKVHSIFYCLYSAAFSLFVLVITVRLRFRNPVMQFLGNHVFSIYILQRIPLGVFQNVFSNHFVYFGVSFAVTVIVSVAFDFASGKIRNLIAERNRA